MAEPIIKTFADYQKYNFFRTPGWRWERVLQLIDRPGQQPGRCTRRDDNIVRTARSFVLQWRYGEKAMRQRLIFEQPGLHFAYEYHQKALDDPDNAMFIQARLLARQTPEQIGHATGMLPDAVVWYANLFFDVLPYLDQRDWITREILLPALKRTANVETTGVPVFKDNVVAKPFLDGSLKLFAYFGGSNLVDLLLSGFGGNNPLPSHDDFATWADGIHAQAIRRRSMVAAQLFEVNKYNVMELFATHAQIMALEKAADDGAKKSERDRHIEALVNEIPWMIGDDVADGYKQSRVSRMDNSARELRDSELLKLGSGREIDDLPPEERFPDTFPPPRGRNTLATTETVELP